MAMAGYTLSIHAILLLLLACLLSLPTYIDIYVCHKKFLLCILAFMEEKRGRSRGGKGIHTHWDVCMHAAGCLRNEDFKDNKKLQRANIFEECMKTYVYMESLRSFLSRLSESAPSETTVGAVRQPAIAAKARKHFHLGWTTTCISFAAPLPPQKASNNAQWCLDK